MHSNTTIIVKYTVNNQRRSNILVQNEEDLYEVTYTRNKFG